MRLLAVQHHHRAFDFVRVGEQLRVDEREGGRLVPAAVRVERACVVAARRLVVGVVVLDELRSVVRQLVGNASAKLVRSGLEVLYALCVHRLLLRLARRRAVLLVEVAVRRHPRHVVHRRGDRRLDACVDRRRVDGEAAPSADAEDADLVGVNVVARDKIIHRRLKVLRVDVGRSHVARFAARFAGEGRIERDCQETAFGERLRVEAARLLLNRAERTGNRDCRKLSAPRLRLVHVRSERDAETVRESRLGVFNLLGLRERLVPILNEFETICVCCDCHCQPSYY